jgi:hypothetical protein
VSLTRRATASTGRTDELPARQPPLHAPRPHRSIHLTDPTARAQRQHLDALVLAEQEHSRKVDELDAAIAEHRAIPIARAGMMEGVPLWLLEEWARQGLLHIDGDRSGRLVMTQGEARKLRDLRRLRHQPPRESHIPEHSREQYSPPRGITSVNPTDWNPDYGPS